MHEDEDEVLVYSKQLYKDKGVDLYIKGTTHISEKNKKYPSYTLVMDIKTEGVAEGVRMQASLQGLQSPRDGVRKKQKEENNFVPIPHELRESYVTVQVHGKEDSHKFAKHYEEFCGWDVKNDMVSTVYSIRTPEGDPNRLETKKVFSDAVANKQILSIYDDKTAKELRKDVEKFYDLTSAIHKHLDKTWGDDRYNSIFSGSSAKLKPAEAEAELDKLPSLKVIQSLTLKAPGFGDEIARAGTKTIPKMNARKWTEKVE